ncbi:(Fe-S)-binding protein [Candidatus Bipolaricaulota bacterium]|nr:(Fe-S)-binding protein [Candidatus Bipolaricaulota bacterium]
MRLTDYRNQIYSCLRCGFCFDHAVGGGEKICPSYAVYGYESYGARGKMALARALVDGVLDYDEDIAHRAFACTECGACQQECFKYLPLSEIYDAMKQDLAERDLLPEGRRALLDPLAEHGNPYGKAADRRTAWAPGTQRVGRTADVVLYVGCTPSYVRRSIARSAYTILEALGIDFALLDDEVCCGHPLVTMGRPDLAQQPMDRNLASIERSGARVVLFACPGCLTTFREWETRQTSHPLPFQALHLTEYLASSHSLESLSLGKRASVATYHDPCTLGRGLGVYDAPRHLLRAVPSSRLVEMPRTRERSYCCGSGGFARFDHESMSVDTERTRLQEAVRTGADTLVSACPACQIGLLDAVRRERLSIEVLDILEWIASAL